MKIDDILSNAPLNTARITNIGAYPRWILLLLHLTKATRWILLLLHLTNLVIDLLPKFPKHSLYSSITGFKLIQSSCILEGFFYLTQRFLGLTLPKKCFGVSWTDF